MIESHLESELKWRQKLARWATRFRFALVGASIIGVGLLCKPAAHWLGLAAFEEYAKHLGEALMIAGVLAIAVDPLLKRELVEYVSGASQKDMIQRAFGFPLPPLILQRIHSFTTFRFVSINQRLTFRFEPPHASTGRVRVWIEHEYDLQNLQYADIKIRPRRVFPEYEGAALHLFRWIDVNGDEHKEGDGIKDLLIQSAESGHEGERIFELDTEITLPGRPSEQTEAPTIKFFVSSSIDGLTSWGHNLASWTTPAIGIKVVVVDAEKAGLCVVPHGPPSDRPSSNVWEWTSAIMPFEVIAIRWFPARPEGT